MTNEKNIFYTIEVAYCSGGEVKIFRVVNCTGRKVMEVREGACVAGVYRKIDADTGEVILPWNIRSLMVYKQAYFFNAAEEDKPLTK